MPKSNYFDAIQNTIDAISLKGVSKAEENIIAGYAGNKAIIGKKEYLVFNSNDYLGLRLHKSLIQAELEATEKFGVGPGAVRFIGGTLSVHKELECSLADFHSRDDAILFSSAFSANVAVLSALLAPPKNSEISQKVLIVSDELNHRSIVDGIKTSGLSKEGKKIFPHLDYQQLDKILIDNHTDFDRAIVVTDGIFSMLGEPADLKLLRNICDICDERYKQGILLVIDDSHGVGVYGKTGRGCEERHNVHADLLIGTLGKAFGSDGGYVVGRREIITYLRETAATYIYSNAITPGTAAAALSAVKLISSHEGKLLQQRLNQNIYRFKEQMSDYGFKFHFNSDHAIQPLIVGDTKTTKDFAHYMYKNNILVTNISYPVVPAEKDEIRIQISANHTPKDIVQLCKQSNEFRNI